MSGEAWPGTEQWPGTPIPAEPTPPPAEEWPGQEVTAAPKAATVAPGRAHLGPNPPAGLKPVDRDELARQWASTPNEPKPVKGPDWAGIPITPEFTAKRAASMAQLEKELPNVSPYLQKQIAPEFSRDGSVGFTVAPNWDPKEPAAGLAFGRVHLDPTRPREAFEEAKKQGWLTPEAEAAMAQDLPLLEKTVKAKAEYAEALKAAGLEDTPQTANVLAEIYGAGRGGAGIGGAIAGGALMRLIATRNPLVAGALAVGGSAAGAYAGTAGYDAAAKKLGEYHELVRAAAAAPGVDPEAAARGELATLILPLPGSLGKLVEGTAMVNRARGALAAAKFAGTNVAGGAAGGAATALVIEGIDSAMSGENKFSVGSTTFGAALGAVLSGHNLRFRNYNTAEVAGILQRGLAFERARVATPDGEALPKGVEPLPPREKEVFDTALQQLRQLRGADPETVQIEGRQVEGLGRGATELQTSARDRAAGLVEEWPGTPVDSVPGNTPGNTPRTATEPPPPASRTTGAAPAEGALVSGADGSAGALAEGVTPGGPTQVFGTRGTEFPAQYAWVRNGEVQTSHSGQMMAVNPSYALKNTRDYSAPEERDKQLAVLKDFDPRRHVTDAADASVGPSLVATITDEQGNTSLQRLGGNSRGYAITNLPPAQRAGLRTLENAKAAQFGLPATTDPDAELVRYLGQYDFREPGVRDQVQGMVDALNPSAGLTQGAAKRAELDAANVPPARLDGLTMNLSPQDAQGLVRGLIAEQRVDRNLTGALAEHAPTAQDYAQRLLATVAFANPQLTDTRMDGRTAGTAVRGLLDAAVPSLVRMRGLGEAGNSAAGAVTRALANTVGALGKGGLPAAIDVAARQGELDPEARVANEVADGLRAALVTDGKGRVLAEPTAANAETLFGLIARAMADFDPASGGDLFGNVETPAEIVTRAVRHFRDRGLAVASEGGSVRRSAGPRTLAPVSPALPTRSQEATAPSLPSGPLFYAAKGSAYANVPMAGLADMKIIEMPELVALAKELMGSPVILGKMPKALGVFVGLGNGLVKLDPRIFQDPILAAKVLAHEIGHSVDFLPHQTLKRGNLWGRIWSLKNFLKDKWTASGPSNKLLRKELLDWTRYWKPYNAASAPASYVAYRESGVELYADFISGLFNSPATVKTIAPTFYKEFWNGLQTKPDVKQALIELQQWLAKPVTERHADRALNVKEMFAFGAEAFENKLAERQERYAGFRGWMSRLKQAVYDRYAPIQDRAAAAGNTPQANRVAELFDAHPLSDNRNWRLLERIHRTVIEPLEAAGFTLDDLGMALFYDRVANESYPVSEAIAKQSGIATGGRTVIANPLGHVPKTARDGLLMMRLQNGMRRQTLLDHVVAKFHDEVFQVMQEAHRAEMLTDEQMSAITANRDHYAAFVPLEYVDTFVPAGIFKQTGTLKEIANPFVSTVLKLVTMQRAIEYQKLKVSTRDLLNQSFPGEIKPAKTRTDTTGRKQPIEPRERGWELMMLREAGKPAWYEIPSEVSAMFEVTPQPLLAAALELINWPFRTFFYPLFIKYNPIFQFVANPIRDVRRNLQNKPMGVGWGAILRQLPIVKQIGGNKLLEDVRAFIREGEVNPLIAEMLANLAITPGEATFYATAGRPLNTFDRILEQHGLLPPGEQGWKLWELPGFKQVRAVGKQIEIAGQMNELLGKATMYQQLRDVGWAPKDAGLFVRSYAGTPNFRKKGVHVSIPNAVFPFFNVWQQGMSADIALARKGFRRRVHPNKPGTSASAWWLRWAMTSGVWTTMKVAASLGLLGVTLKKLMDGIGNYDKTNYDVIPVGYGGESDVNPDGDVGFVRIPKDPTDRLLSGMYYNTVRALGLKAAQAGAFGDDIAEANAGADSSVGAAMMKNVSLGAGDVPGLNPLLKIGVGWKQWLSGQNPIDDFRGSTILSDAEHLAGGWDRAKPMLSWTLNQTGVQNFYRYDPNAHTTLEIGVGNAPLLNGLVKMTDLGYRQQQAETQKLEDIVRAQVKLSLSADVQTLATEYWHLRGLEKHRSAQQEGRYQQLNEWHTQAYEPLTEGLRNSEDGDTKTMLREALDRASKGYLPAK